MDQGLKQDQGHSSRTRILRGRSNKLLENKFYRVYRHFKILQTSNLRKGDVVISTKLNIQELRFFRLAYFIFSQSDNCQLMCQRAHSDNKCQWTIQQTSRNCYSALTVIHKLTLLLNISYANMAQEQFSPIQ